MLLVLLGTTSSAQSHAGKAIKRYDKPLKTVTLDLETGVITRAPAVGNKTVPTCSNFDNADLGGFVGVDTGNKFCEWFCAGTTRDNCDTDMMASILFGYCSAKLDVESGGPGGSVRLGFFEGYALGGGVPTTPCVVFTLTGLPANTASSSFFGGFKCYFIRVTFGSIVTCRKGDIGYSWHFMDLGADGLLAATFPMLACIQSCSGNGPDNLGMVNFLDEYCPSGVFPPRATFSFNTGGMFDSYFTSVSMRIEKLVETPSTLAHYNGNQGCNHDCWTVTPPSAGNTPPAPATGFTQPDVATIGGAWGPTIGIGNCNGSHSPAGPGPNGHGASGTVSIKVLVPGTSINGPCPPAASAPYNRRVELTSSGTFALALPGFLHNGTLGTPPPQAVPKDVAFVGATWAAYADIVGQTIRDRSSTLYGVVGNTP